MAGIALLDGRDMRCRLGQRIEDSVVTVVAG